MVPSEPAVLIFFRPRAMKRGCTWKVLSSKKYPVPQFINFQIRHYYFYSRCLRWGQREIQECDVHRFCVGDVCALHGPNARLVLQNFYGFREFGVGLSASSLDRLNDCPRNAYYMDAFYAGSDGEPVKISDAFCIFERYAEDVSWRHTEAAIPNLVVSNL